MNRKSFKNDFRVLLIFLVNSMRLKLLKEKVLMKKEKLKSLQIKNLLLSQNYLLLIVGIKRVILSP